jgi:hypothetical protein
MYMRYLLGLICGLALATTGCETAGGDEVETAEDGGSQGGGRGGSNEDQPLPRLDASVSRDAQISSPELDAASGDDEDAGDDIAIDVPDPAPQATAPGEYGCPGCPDADVSEFQLALGSATMQPFSGIVTGAVGNGQFYLESAGGQSVGGVIPTGDSGGFDFTVPLFCGTQLLKCVWNNDAGQYVAVVEIVTTDCIDADIRITLTWDDKGLDFELHLVKEGGAINDNATDCTWTSCNSAAGPDWGVVGDPSDNPRKDVDNTGNFGPENIYYANPEPGTYTVMVEHWGGGSADADGQVTINLFGEPTQVIDITDLTSHHVFTAGTIEWPAKVVTLSGAEHDCTANWASGCRDPLP